MARRKPTATVTAKLIDRMDYLAARNRPGAFFYVRRLKGVVGMIHSCPCGCRSLSYLNLDAGRGDRPVWTKTGTDVRPTLDQAVVIRNDAEEDHWRGHLKTGAWVK
jgi:hypothetical protein